MRLGSRLSTLITLASSLVLSRAARLLWVWVRFLVTPLVFGVRQLLITGRIWGYRLPGRVQGHGGV